jgi:hypothetical protein
MRRFSVRTLMVLIVGAAVGLAALRNANVYWAATLVAVVLAAVATSLTGAMTLRGREQCGWAGFAIFSTVYLVGAVASEFSLSFRELFGPTAALEYVQSKVSGDRSDPWLRERASLLQLMVALQQSVDEQKCRQWVALKARVDWLDAQQAQASRDSADRWRSWLSGAANVGEFGCVGHCLFALLSGLIGTVVGRIFYARRERSETQTRRGIVK